MRDGQQRVHALAVAAPAQFQRQAEAAIGDERERMGRVDGDRRDDQQDLVEEALVEMGPVGSG
jgi:hypothetical protein